MKEALLVLVLVVYASVVGLWVVKRLRKGKHSSVSGATKQVLVEHGGQKILIDFDSVKNKVLVEFTQDGMVFKIIDGAFYDEDEVDLTDQGDVIIKDVFGENPLLKTQSSGVSKL
jgi:hypothetical protein